MCQAPKQLRGVVDRVEDVRRSAVMAGIVPDKRHLKSGGYHVCLYHLRTHGRLGDYSSVRTLDRPPKVSKAGEGYSCAYDIGMSKADMIRTHGAVRKVWLDRSDPRRKYVNAINCWDGSGNAVRYNFQQNTSGYATPDHKTHVHGDAPRVYMDPAHKEHQKAARAHASILIGESRAAWEAREEPKKATTPKPKAAPTTWPVKAGDTLSKIAGARKVSVAQLQAWNNLGRSTTIYVGQTLRTVAPAPKPKPKPKAVVPAWPVAADAFFRPRKDPPAYKTVGRWQAAMKAHGWTITVDDYLGPKSGAVLLAFQRAEGLKVTGVLDKATFVRAFTTTKRGR
jgi:LysM repeat protein